MINRVINSCKQTKHPGKYDIMACLFRNKLRYKPADNAPAIYKPRHKPPYKLPYKCKTQSRFPDLLANKDPY